MKMGKIYWMKLCLSETYSSANVIQLFIQFFNAKKQWNIIPPPCSYAKYGNLQTFPMPTDSPTQERRNSHFDPQFPLEATVYVDNFRMEALPLRLIIMEVRRMEERDWALYWRSIGGLVFLIWEGGLWAFSSMELESKILHLRDVWWKDTRRSMIANKGWRKDITELFRNQTVTDSFICFWKRKTIFNIVDTIIDNKSTF